MSRLPRSATWRLAAGPANAITDVPGVLVGHATVLEPSRGVATGVSVVVPEGVEERALPAACHVINGYGKSAGLVQVDELGTLESPIVLTSVFAVPAVQDALLRRRLASDPAVGGPQGRSVNLVVLECNDARLNDPREFTCGGGELALALDSAAGGTVEQGTVGAGTGMSTFGLSGGFGTSSRVFGAGGREYHLGVALVSNFGVWGDLTIGGRLVQTTEPTGHGEGAGEGVPDGSVVIVVATDAPFDRASLRRVCVRAQNGLARTGCMTAHGSGELVLAFSTQTSSVREPEPELLNQGFRAVAEAVEEAVLSGLSHAEPVTGRQGRRLPVLRDLTL